MYTHFIFGNGYTRSRAGGEGGAKKWYLGERLEGVQIGTSRPLGSLEIQKTKVETVLVDTLYIKILIFGLKFCILYFVNSRVKMCCLLQIVRKDFLV